MAKVNLMTQAQYAEHRGVSRVAVHKAVKDGRISTIDGKLDPAVADIQWSANTRARASSSSKSCAAPATAGASDASIVGAAGGSPGSEGMFEFGGEDYQRSRARREAAEASIAEMKQAEMEGLLVRREDVERAAFVSARQLRDGLTNCARRLGATVATLTTPDECTAAIEREHRALLQSWSKAMSMTDQIEAMAP